MDDIDHLAQAYLECPDDKRSAWIHCNPACLSLALVQHLKLAGDRLLRTDGALAERISQANLDIVHWMPHEPLAIATAQWGRGNWSIYHRHEQTLHWYESALTIFRQFDDQLSVARILTNLVGVYTDQGAFEPASHAYNEATTLYKQLDQEISPYRLVLEQNYGVLLRRHHQHTEALHHFAIAKQLAQDLNLSDRMFENQVNHALLLLQIGELNACEQELLEARYQALIYDHLLTVARIDMNLGEFYAVIGQPAKAIRSFHEARKGFIEQQASMEDGSVLLREGILYDQIGSYSDACRVYEQASTCFRLSGMLPQVAESLTRAGIASGRSGFYQQAYKQLQAAEDMWCIIANFGWLETVTLEKIKLQLDQGDLVVANQILLNYSVPSNPYQRLYYEYLRAYYAELQHQQSPNEQYFKQALFLYAQVLAFAVDQQHHFMQRDVYQGLARLWTLTNPKQAFSYVEHALNIEQQLRHTLSIAELKASLHAQSLTTFLIGLRLLLQRSDPFMLLNFVWQMKGSALVDILLQSTEHQSLDEAEQHLLKTTRHELAIARWNVHQSHDDQIRLIEALNPTIRELEHRLQQLRRQLNLSASHHQPRTFTQPQTIFNATLATCLLEYFACDTELFAIRLDRTGAIVYKKVCDIPVLMDVILALQFNVHDVLTLPCEERGAYLEHYRAESIDLLAQCYQLLITPLGSFHDDEYVLIAPCDPLYLIPFSALWDGECYFGDRVVLETTPCGAILGINASTDGVHSQPLIIGASASQSLTSVAEEIDVIRSVHPDCLYCYDDVHDVTILSELSVSPHFLHLSTHSIIRHDTPLFSALQLSGGLFSVEQCYELPLTGTDFVTLSGCTTATGLDTGGSLLAFQSAFFIAGAQRVVSSLWEVHDQATPLWMQTFYTAVIQQQSIPHAIQMANMQLRQRADYDHPAFWAVFMSSCR